MINSISRPKTVRNLKNLSWITVSLLLVLLNSSLFAQQSDTELETWLRAREHIDKMALKYLNQPEYPYYGGETRVKYFIKPERVMAYGRR